MPSEAVYKTDSDLAQALKKQSAKALWETLQDLLAEADEKSQAKLQEEAQFAGLDVGRTLLNMAEMNPLVSLQLFRQHNPEISLQNLDSQDPYKVAAAVLRMMAPGE